MLNDVDNLQPKKTANLKGVKGLVHLGGQLLEMEKMIGSLMENEFVSVFMDEIGWCRLNGGGD